MYTNIINDDLLYIDAIYDHGKYQYLLILSKLDCNINV